MPSMAQQTDSGMQHALFVLLIIGLIVGVWVVPLQAAQLAMIGTLIGLVALLLARLVGRNARL